MWLNAFVLADGLPLAVTTPATDSQTITIGGSLAALLGSGILLLVSYLIGKRVSAYVKIDDIARVIIALFGITGVLLTIPAFSGFRNWVHGLVTAMAGGANGNGPDTAVIIITGVLAAIGIYIFYKRFSWFNLLLFVLLTATLFRSDTMLNIAEGWAGTVGQNVWDAVYAGGAFVVDWVKSR